MKQLLLVLTLTLSTVVMSQNEVNPKSSPIAHVTENKDTMWVAKEMYALYVDIWNMPINADAKPVLIPVHDMDRFKATLVGRKD